MEMNGAKLQRETARETEGAWLFDSLGWIKWAECADTYSWMPRLRGA